MRGIIPALAGLVVAALAWLNVPGVQAGPFTKELVEREAVQKGVDFLSQGSVYWIRDRGCFTCHAVGLGALANGLSAGNGYAVNQHEFDTLARFVLTLQRPDGSLLGGKREVSLTAVMGTGFARACGSVAKDYAAPIGKMAQFLAVAQSKVGNWVPDYQRDVVITGDVMTGALALQVLKETAGAGQASEKFAATQTAWARSLKPTELTKTTDLAFALLGKAVGPERTDLPRLQAQLFALQNADGGWPLQKGGKSGNIITSQALWALAASGASRTEPRVHAAVNFLLQQQREDGTWVPDGQGKDFNKFVQKFTRTAWAVVGLSSILEVNSLRAKRAEIIAELQQELAAAKGDAAPLHRLARAQLLLRDGEGACQSFDKLVALAPQKVAYQLERARAYLGTGAKAKAIKAYQQTLALQMPVADQLAALQTVAECQEELGDHKLAALTYLQLLNPQFAQRPANARRLLPKLTPLGPASSFTNHYGFVTAYDIAGPFPHDGEEGFAKVALPDQTSPWRPFPLKDTLGALDLAQVFPKTDAACAFVRLQLASPETKQAQLRLSSDGPLVVYLNDKEVYRQKSGRDMFFDQDKVNLTIAQGTSTVLIKVGQNKGRWGLITRLTDRQGQPLAGVKAVTAAK